MFNEMPKSHLFLSHFQNFLPYFMKGARMEWTTCRSRAASVYAQILPEAEILLAPSVPLLKSQIASPIIRSVTQMEPMYHTIPPFDSYFTSIHTPNPLR